MLDRRAVIVSNDPIADGVSEIVLSLGAQEEVRRAEPCDAVSHVPQPGQFAHVSIPGFFLRRPISVAGYDEPKGLVRLLVGLAGEGSMALLSLPAGREVRALLPLGRPFPMNIAADVASSGGKIWVVSGGIGLAPLLFAAGRARGLGAALESFIGFRDEGRVFGLAEMESFGKVSLSIGGLVTARVMEALDRETPALVLACGPEAMLRALRAICVPRGIPAYASLEARMGCGVGACLACSCGVTENGAVRNRRVCADGPVFNLAEVVFK